MKPKTKERILFNQFLKENNCVKQFVWNFNNSHYGKPNENLIDFLDEFKNEGFFSPAFVWSKTPEGNDYWNRLNTKWNEISVTLNN